MKATIQQSLQPAMNKKPMNALSFTSMAVVGLLVGMTINQANACGEHPNALPGHDVEMTSWLTDNEPTADTNQPATQQLTKKDKIAQKKKNAQIAKVYQLPELSGLYQPEKVSRASPVKGN